jgi:hypothetical protein
VAMILGKMVLQLAKEQSQRFQLTAVFQCCRSESGRIGIILMDPNWRPGPIISDLEPDSYIFQPNAKPNYIYFPEYFNILSKILKIEKTYDADEKDKTNANFHSCE